MTSNELPQGMAQNTISLMLGHPDPETLLTPELRNAMEHVISSPQAYTGLQYGPEQGTQSLITFLLEKIDREQGLSLHHGNLMLVAGSTQAVDMLARLYARPGGVVLVEAPTYVDAIHIFRDHQIELCSIPVDEDGLITSELEKQVAMVHSSGKLISFLYTVPNYHNPTGSTLPEARRIEIIKLARHYGFMIVEDDVYRDLSFDGAVPASFYALAASMAMLAREDPLLSDRQTHASLANNEQVLSIGSFSKTLAPGLRLGWLLGSEDAIQYCINCGTTQMGGGANPFAAQIVAEYCRSGYWEKHIEYVQSLYKTRRDVALSALDRYMPSDVRWTHPAGGFFIWLSLPKHVFAQHVKRLALQKGVLLAAGEGFFVNPVDGEHNLRLAYSCAVPSEIDTGIRIVAQVIERLMNYQAS
jgi:2-aminoadipate transaminase